MKAVAIVLIFSLLMLWGIFGAIYDAACYIVWGGGMKGLKRKITAGPFVFIFDSVFNIACWFKRFSQHIGNKKEKK